MNERSPSFVPGVTLRSLVASITCMLLAGLYTQFVEVILAAGNPAEQALPLPALAVLLLLILSGGLLYALGRIRLLSRAELLCVFYAMLLSVPMMTQGMWHRLVGLMSATPRSGNFEYIDTFHDNLWPHGKNVLEDLLVPQELATKGNAPTWSVQEYEEGLRATLPELKNTRSSEESSFSITLDLAKFPDLVPSDPHLFSVLVNTSDTGPESFVFCRVYEDGSDRFRELVQSAEANTVTFLHRKGYVRLGTYGVSLSSSSSSSLRFEFGLNGRGSARFADPKFFNVSSLESVYKGRTMMSESAYEALAPSDRPPGIIVKPDHLFSLAGLKFIIAGYIPLKDWLTPAFTWGSFIFLLLSATLAMAVIMRRQWAESERYPFPLTRIPLAMIGADEERDLTGPFARVWSSRYLWAGFAIAVLWGGLKGWNFYNNAVPDTSINVSLAPYFTGSGWGKPSMWATTFTVSLFLVSLAIFFELNVLISLVVGFWLFRSLHWVGEFTSWNTTMGYPFRYEQCTGAYLGYFAAVLFFSRTYLASVLKQAVRGGKEDPADVLSYRSALLLLVASFAGAAYWGTWLGASLSSILLYFTFLVSIGFVSIKLRAECGLPAGYFTPYNAMVLVSVLGGMTAFGAKGMMLALLFSGFLTVTVFFLIPGAQLELIQTSRRLNVVPRHVIYACLIGLFGGLLIGGWVFLSNSYALGGDSIRYQWAYNQEWFFSSYKAELANATTKLTSAGLPETDAANWPARTVLFSGVVTVVLTLVRQLFSGFWFHPIGFILGSTHMLEDCWGSLLVAWAIRSLVLKFGGAAGVRNKLQPFFVGALAGCVVIATAFYVIGAISMASGSTSIYTGLP